MIAETAEITEEECCAPVYTTGTRAGSWPCSNTATRRQNSKHFQKRAGRGDLGRRTARARTRRDWKASCRLGETLIVTAGVLCLGHPGSGRGLAGSAQLLFDLFLARRRRRSRGAAAEQARRRVEPRVGDAAVREAARGQRRRLLAPDRTDPRCPLKRPAADHSSLYQWLVMVVPLEALGFTARRAGSADAVASRAAATARVRRGALHDGRRGQLLHRFPRRPARGRGEVAEGDSQTGGGRRARSCRADRRMRGAAVARRPALGSLRGYLDIFEELAPTRARRCASGLARIRAWRPRRPAWWRSSRWVNCAPWMHGGVRRAAGPRGVQRGGAGFQAESRRSPQARSWPGLDATPKRGPRRCRRPAARVRLPRSRTRRRLCSSVP